MPRRGRRGCRWRRRRSRVLSPGSAVARRSAATPPSSGESREHAGQPGAGAQNPPICGVPFLAGAHVRGGADAAFTARDQPAKHQAIPIAARTRTRCATRGVRAASSGGAVMTTPSGAPSTTIELGTFRCASGTICGPRGWPREGRPLRGAQHDPARQQDPEADRGDHRELGHCPDQGNREDHPPGRDPIGEKADTRAAIEKNRKNPLDTSPYCVADKPRSCMIGLAARPRTALSAKLNEHENQQQTGDDPGARRGTNPRAPTAVSELGSRPDLVANKCPPWTVVRG